LLLYKYVYLNGRSESNEEENTNEADS